MLKDRLFVMMMLGAVMLGATLGCRKDNEKPDPKPEVNGSVAVNLRADILPTSPGINRSVANDQWEAEDKVGLFMKRAGQALTAPSAIYGDANNLQTSIVNGSLTVTPTLKYPETGNVDFIAYHPYHASVGAGYTIPVNVAGQEAGLPVEVLYSNNITNQPPTEQAVTLNFQYSLAKVEIIVTGGSNSELTAADFAAMTVTVHGLPTQATLNLANGTFTGIGEKQPISLHRKGSTSTSATFEMLALPTTDEAVTFIFNAAGKLTMHETTVTYEAAKLYRTTFALDYPEVVKHTTYIAPRGEEPPQNISISAGTRYMTMTTAAQEVGIVLRGDGKAFVDWGDGSPLETLTLTTDNNERYTHSYIETTARTITIYGDDVTYFLCGGSWQSGSQWISNQLTALDVSNNTALEQLNCANNQLTALDVSNNTALRGLYCNLNQLTALDVSRNTELINLQCAYNQLTSLDISNNTELTTLYCGDNQLTTLDVSNNKALEQLYCLNNQLTALDVSNNTALEQLYCLNNQLTALDVSNNMELTWLRCDNNQLTVLDLSNNTELQMLVCTENKLTALDVSNNTELRELWCNNNQLTVLDVSNNTALTDLACNNNQLTALDVSNNTELTWLNCGNNQLTVLDVSNNTELISLFLYDNLFTASSLNDLFGTLHSNPPPQSGNKYISIGGNPGAFSCDRSIATAKGWEF